MSAQSDPPPVVRTLQSERGRLLVVGDGALVEDAARIALAALDEERSPGRFVELGAGRAWLKASRFRGKARARHGLRGLAGLAVPRLRERANLAWLRARGFGAPLPLAAGRIGPRAAPRAQFLFTREVPAPTLRALCEEPGRAPRPDVFDALGRDLARLFACGFVHCDLFPRNLLVDERDGTPRIVYLDAWRGGAWPQLRSHPRRRGPVYDVASLMLFGSELFHVGEQIALVRALFLGVPPERRARRLARIARRRDALARRFNRRRRPDSLLPPAPPTWDVAPLLDALR